MFEHLGFPTPYPVTGRASIADLFESGSRCGLYILHFATGEFYAGQAVDVVRRYAQHRQVHQDIVSISFRCVDRSELNDTERRLIATLERSGCRLRNIALTSIPYGPSDFDLLMDAAAQARWLSDVTFVDDAGSRPDDPELRRKYARKFALLQASPHYPQAVEFLRLYARIGLPALHRGELSFWAVSCLPEAHILARISVNWQEVCTLYVDDGKFYASLHVADSPLRKLNRLTTSRFRSQYHLLQVQTVLYATGGQDQRHIVAPIAAAQRMLLDARFWPALRLFNLRLMQKGPCAYGRYHCFDLADQMLDFGTVLPRLSGDILSDKP
ncbi:MAG: hypothetical protein U0X20_27105 [Caldilineaceae bacterium]